MANGWSAQNIEFPIIAWGGGIGGDPAQWPSQFEALQQGGYNIVGGTQHPITDIDPIVEQGPDIDRLEDIRDIRAS